MTLSKRIASGRPRAWSWSFWVLLAVLASGCGKKSVYPVHGQIVDTEGQPVTGMKGAAVEFEGVENGVSANASVEEDGTFRLTTESPGDGAHVGKHRVAIMRPYLGPDTPAPHLIHPKYEDFTTSELEVTVEPKDNEVRLVVERVRRRR